MSELFVAFRDGYMAARVGGAKLWPGGLPDYVGPERREKDGEDLFRDFGHLVQRGDH